MGSKPQVGEVWVCLGLWADEVPTPVRVMEVTPSGMYDVNYQLDPAKPEDLRIVPPQSLELQLLQHRVARLSAQYPMTIGRHFE